MKYLIYLLTLIYSVASFSQSKKIKILSADNTFVKPEYPGATISQGNVFLEHDGATVRCDKAYIYQSKKLIKAMGNVVFNQGDTITQTSKYTDYDGIKRKAKSWGNVILKDELMTLKTDTLLFDRNEQKLYYQSGGTIIDSTNVLNSKIGNFYLTSNTFKAFNKVTVTNENSLLKTNHLDYNTETGIAELYGPSKIIGKKDSIYTERGIYKSKTDIATFIKNSIIYYQNRTIKGDSLYYNGPKSFASATNHIQVIDTTNQSVIKGNYAEYFRDKDSVFITKKALAISTVDKDSLFMHSDTIMVTGKVDQRIVKGFHHVKFYKSDLQGKCDSIITIENLGITKLLKQPVIWAQGNQITGDSIHLISAKKTNKLDSLKILGNGFMINKDSAGFSQLKAKNMYGKFKNNELNSLNAVGNSEVVFYIRDEKNKLVGISKMKTSKNIFITLKNRAINTVDFNIKPDGKTYPPSKMPEEEKLLRGFIWRETEQPLNKESIFKQ